MKKFIAIFVALSLFTILTVAACGTTSTTGTTGTTGGTGGNAGASVHMGEVTFTQTSVTISKGSSLNLIDDVPVTHIISNGTWVNSVAKPAIEPGAPTVSNLQFNTAGQSMTVGPFNNTGTFQIYCSVHVNMNLTVIVE